VSFTQEIEQKLKADLPASHVKQREKGDTTLSYLESWRAIDSANNIFGFGAWDSLTVYCKEVSRVPVKVGKGQYQADGWKVGYEAHVRIIAGGATKEGTGHGSQTSKDLFDAIEGAAKEAESDAQKRALRLFGNQFGLCLYDKEQEGVADPIPPAPSPEKLAVIEIIRHAKSLNDLKDAWATANANNLGYDRDIIAEKNTRRDELTGGVR
jgi:DNA repair and recombination protein RAD52